MAKPLPPIVHGPITPASSHVQVTGALPGAEVVVLADGSAIGKQVASSPGLLWVPLSTSATAGQKITATQSNANGTSTPSNVPVVVIDLPDPLPSPVYLSPLSVCMTRVWLDALIPGATVTIMVNGQQAAKVSVIRPTEWINLSVNVNLPTGSRLETFQELVVGGQTLSSAVVLSTPLVPLQVQSDRLPPPKIAEPLQACQTSLGFSNMVPAADVRIENEGQIVEWTNIAESYTGVNGPPLLQGKLTARQVFPRCNRQSDDVVLPVQPPGTPPKPVVGQELCPQVLRFTVSGLIPGAILHLTRVVQLSSNVQSISEIGEMGVSSAVEQVDLPADFEATDSDGPVLVWVTQILCGASSPYNEVSVAVTGGPYPAPAVKGPLFDCGRQVAVTGAHPGSLLQVFSLKGPRSDAVAAANSDLVIKLWTPLVAGEDILVRQTGCNAGGDSKTEPVQKLPDPLPIPKIIAPVRPSSPSVSVANIVPGARVYLLVNNIVRTSIDVLETQAVIPVSSPPLVESDRLFAVQALCAKLSALEGEPVIVTKGQMKVSVSPTSVQRGSTAQVTVSAVDADTNQPISGAQVLLNNVPVGSTGSPFAYAPKLGDPNPAGLVREPVAHFDAAFSIALVDPPPKPKGILTLKAGPALLTIGLTVTNVSWTVTPLWNTPGLNLTGLNASSPLADPPPPKGQFSVTGKITVNANGWINGYFFPNQTWDTPIPAGVFVWEGKDLGLGWLILWNMLVDGDGNALIVIDPKYAGPQS